jgi:hypothetical protein
MGRSESAF